MQMETQGLNREYHCPFHGMPAHPSPPVHAAESHLSASVSFHRIYLCDKSSEREERRLPRVSAQPMLKPRESPFSLPLKLLSPFFPLASWF